MNPSSHPYVARALLVVVTGACIALGTAGCGDVCERIVAFETECGRFKDKVVDNAQIVAQCQDGLATKPPRRAVSERKECAESAGDCEAYVACHQAKRTARIVARIEENLAQKAPEDAVVQCEKFKRRIPDDEALTNACRRALAAFTESTEWFRVEPTCRMEWVSNNKALVEHCDAAFARGLKASVKDRKFYDLKNSCAGAYVKDHPTAQKACKTTLAATFKDLSTAMKAVRDGTSPNDKLWTRCSNLKTVGEAVGSEEKLAAQALCKEAEAGSQVATAVARATEEMKKERRTLPRECDNAMKKLAKLQETPWRDQARAKVIAACYGTLAPTILSATVPRMKHCAYAVRKILEAVDTYSLKSPALLKQLPAARRKCKR